MDVIVEQNKKNSKELAHEFIEGLSALVKEWKNQTSLFIKEDMIPYLKTVMENIKDCLGDRVIVEEVDVLDKETLVEIAKKHLVAEANQVAAYKKMKGDSYVLYLTYCVDRKQLPKDQNKTIIIKAEAMNKATKELFKDSDLIILI